MPEPSEFDVDPDDVFCVVLDPQRKIVAANDAFYRAFDEPLDAEASRWLLEMITESGNDPADWLMERIDPDFGPIRVTDTLRDLGKISEISQSLYRQPWHGRFSPQPSRKWASISAPLAVSLWSAPRAGLTEDHEPCASP